MALNMLCQMCKTLDHEIFDEAVEWCIIVISLGAELDEVVACAGCLYTPGVSVLAPC